MKKHLKVVVVTGGLVVENKNHLQITLEQIVPFIIDY